MVKLVELETAIRAKDIIANTFNVDKKGTKFVSPQRLAITPTGYRCITVTKIPRQRARRHVVRVDMDPDYIGPFNRCPQIKIDCDCSRYLFVWNYALVEHDGAIKDRTNNEPPVVTNPAEHPGCCKHGLVVLKLLQRTNPQWQPPTRKKSTASRLIALTSLDKELQRVRKGGA